MAQPLIHGHLYHLPDCKPPGKYIYAARFADGVVKIGSTHNPRSRALSLQVSRRARIEEFHYVTLPKVAKTFGVERAALKRATACAKPIPGHREFFIGLSFDEAVCCITQAAEAGRES